MGEWWTKLGSLVTRRHLDEELREELEAQLEMEIEAGVERGLRPEDAAAAARRQFGSPTAIREAARESWSFRWLDTLSQDVRYTLRVIGRAPAFASTAVLIVALGIGATTAAFALLDYVLVRPLPFSRPEQLVALYEAAPARGLQRIEASPLNFQDWRSMNKSFSSMAAYVAGSLNLSGRGEPMRVDAASIDAAILPTLGAQPALGRAFVAEDDDHADVVILSHWLAVTLFGSPSGAVGQTIDLDNSTRTVIGVMAPGFGFPRRDIALWTPLALSRLGLTRTNHILNLIARLRPGVSLEAARADMAVVTSQLERAYPKENPGIAAVVVGMRDVMSPQARLLIVAVFSGALCLLLIACTNLANLLLARAMARRQEIAVRVAIGAGRARIVRQLMTESLVVSMLGGAFGSVLVMVAVPWLARLVPDALPVGTAMALDGRIVGFAVFLTVATAIFFGAAPAFRSWRHADAQALRSRSSSGRTDRTRAVLVLTEIGTTVTLVVVAGLLVKALWRVQAVDPGFRAEGVMTLRTALPMPKYTAAARRRQFYAQVLTGARALPGVSAAAYTTGVPFVFGAGIFPIRPAGTAEDLSSNPRVSIRFVTPEFFTTLRIPLQRGRYISEGDGEHAPPVAVISQSLADRLWPSEDPIGRRVTIFQSDRAVVGVVADINVRGLERTSEPQIYFSPEQLTPFSTFYAPKDLLVRTSGDPATLVPALRHIVHQMDPEQPVSNVRSFEEIIASQTASRRDQLLVLWTFSAIATILAAVGIYGLLAFTVQARTQEVGVRIALGAGRAHVLGMFLRQGLTLGTAGVALALPVAYAAARGMSGLLFGVQPGDPRIYGAVAFGALLVTVASSLRPAIRASAVSPAISLRAD